MTPVFEYDERSFLVDEPGDWNLCRRMLEAGVRFGGSEHAVVDILHTPPGFKEHDL